MSEIHTPKCGLLVFGLPCMRWPGHLGPCINEKAEMQFSGPGYSAVPDVDTFMNRAKQLLSLGITLLIILGFDTATAIYLLVRLSWRQR